METEALATAQTIDFSILALYARATITAKAVMIILLVASFWSWSIILQKFINNRKARRENGVFEEQFWSGQPLDAFY